MSPQDYADITFLALTVWRKARGESPEVQAGIAHVIMNRVKRPPDPGIPLFAIK